MVKSHTGPGTAYNGIAANNQGSLRQDTPEVTPVEKLTSGLFQKKQAKVGSVKQEPKASTADQSRLDARDFNPERVSQVVTQRENMCRCPGWKVKKAA